MDDEKAKEASSRKGIFLTQMNLPLAKEYSLCKGSFLLKIRRKLPIRPKRGKSRFLGSLQAFPESIEHKKSKYKLSLKH